jgi:hypothetical protein
VGSERLRRHWPEAVIAYRLEHEEVLERAQPSIPPKPQKI